MGSCKKMAYQLMVTITPLKAKQSKAKQTKPNQNIVENYHQLTDYLKTVRICRINPSNARCLLNVTKITCRH